ncbi:MAG TPA: alpha/beta hydrolase [Microthrixaceae bacterium]|nr:alpha/beta hydrolase [Microthrixaceae bacterium]
MRHSTSRLGNLSTGFLAVVTISLAALLTSCVVPPSPRSDARALARGPRLADSTIEYAPGLKASLYKARSGGNRGVIVLVHAGGFYSGSRDDIGRYAHAILDQLDRGFAVLSVDYRLTSGTENLFPAALSDVSTAIDWVRSSGRSHGLNPGTVLVAGHSAGGTIAALIGLGANNPASPRGRTSPVDGWIAISGFYDLRQPGLTALQREVWLGSGASPETISAASAVTLVDAQDPPGYLIHGSADPWVPLAQAFSLGAATLATGNVAWMDVVSEPNCDGHVPTCAVNQGFLNTWVDNIVKR